MSRAAPFMTPEQQNILMAVSLDWKWVKQPGMPVHHEWWLEPPEVWGRYVPEFLESNMQSTQPKEWNGDIKGGQKALPNFVIDLNAVHEAEMTLKPHEQAAYYNEILKDVTGHGSRSIMHQNTRTIVSATAAERVEAILRVKGLWSESKETHYQFTNSEGATISFPASATIDDLVRAGVQEILFRPKDEPPPKDPRIYCESGKVQ